LSCVEIGNKAASTRPIWPKTSAGYDAAWPTKVGAVGSGNAYGTVENDGVGTGDGITVVAFEIVVEWNCGQRWSPSVSAWVIGRATRLPVVVVVDIS
jgi:hypothetical protein